MPPQIPLTEQEESSVTGSIPLKEEDQWLRFFEKLTPTTSLWCQQIDKLSSSSDPEVHWSEFLKKLVTPHDLTTDVYDKILVRTIHIHSNKMGEDAIYLLDLNAPSNTHKYPVPSLNPVIRFSAESPFVILGYELYLFAGWEPEKWMSIYDMRKALSSPSTIDLNDEQDNLKVGPEMTVEKRCPVAVAIGEFRICVFAASLYVKKNGFSKQPSVIAPNFELYDTRKKSWIGLPEPLDWDTFEPKANIYVNSYCVYLCSLIIQTNIGIFGINLNNTNLKWVTMDRGESIKKFPFKGMWKSIDEDALGKKDPQSYVVALKDSTTARDSLIPLCPSGVLCCLGGVNSGSSVNLCSVRGGLALSDRTPHLLVDIVKCGAEALKNLGSDCPTWKEIQSDKSFSFALSSIPSKMMKVIGCYPLKEMDTRAEDSVQQKKNKETEHIGLECGDFFNKAALELEAPSTSRKEGAKGNGFLGCRHQEESDKNLAVGLPSRLLLLLHHLFG